MQTLLVLTAIITGLLAGALLTEARILVPYWQRMPTTEFSRLHHTMAPSLYRFFAPLTVAGTLLPISSWLALFATGSGNAMERAALVSALCAVALLVIYGAFFRNANIRFATETNEAVVENTLSKWAALHALRTAISVLGFVAAVIAATL